MDQDTMVLCSASRYTKKYYLNPRFQGLPERVRQELQIMCVLFTEEVGGIILLYFNEQGKLVITTEAQETDASYDEIGSHLLVKRMQKEKAELFEQMEQYYELFVLGKTE